MANKPTANGAIIWEGPSQIDGAPILVVATGIKGASRNSKTGALIQTWILRSDIHPSEAVHSGADESICGDCQHRGDIVDGKNVNRSCYVTIWQAPANVWRTAQRGVYPRVNNSVSDLFAGRNVRLGAYGDPAAVPFHVWEQALTKAARGTGYTHQWKTCDSRFARYCMASADSLEEAKEAQAMGYRTFRVGTVAESLVKGSEFLCPASHEAGRKVDCAACLACGGTNAPNKSHVFIPAHGAPSKVNAFVDRVSA